MEHKFIYQDKVYSVKIEEAGDSKLVRIDDGNEIKVSALNLGPNTLSLEVDGKIFTAYVGYGKGKSYVFVDGASFSFDKPIGKSRSAGESSVKAMGNKVVSLMPGSLVKLLVSVGDKVEMGQTVAIVEAMKMQNELKSPVGGVVKKINFKQGDQVDAFTPIVELEAI
jgi:biotin carboxyl carrier protein